MLYIFISILIGYLFGSIPTAIWVGKLTLNTDIREHGSGNAGATNAIRVLGWKLGVFVLVVDIFKGFIPVFFLPRIFPFPAAGGLYVLIIAVFTIVGHIFPLFASFKGGKGVGTAAGAFIAIIPTTAAFAFIVFVIMVALFRYVSLGSISGAVTIAVVVPLLNYLHIEELDTAVIIIIEIICIAIIYRHKSNIRRLIRGEENKIKFKEKL